jgi:hypothetical protein
MTFQQWLSYHWWGFYDDGDFIVSKQYGRYPKAVPFVQGMVLYPGQVARIRNEELIEMMRRKA